jgi:hypothetical protein
VDHERKEAKGKDRRNHLLNVTGNDAKRRKGLRYFLYIFGGLCFFGYNIVKALGKFVLTSLGCYLGRLGGSASRIRRLRKGAVPNR